MIGARGPVLGYPSKKAAMVGLYQGGERDLRKIAAQAGSTYNAVRTTLRKAGVMEARAYHRNRAAADVGPGLWTAEKVDKVRRVFALAVEEIARAYSLPPGEVLALLVSGTVPPMGRSGRVGDLRNEAEAAETEPTPQAAPAAPPLQLAAPEIVPEADVPAIAAAEPPSQAAVDADNEAQELIELAATSKAERFRLLAGVRGYVHESLSGFTGNARFAWCGNRRQLRTVLNLYPLYKSYQLEPVFK